MVDWCLGINAPVSFYWPLIDLVSLTNQFKLDLPSPACMLCFIYRFSAFYALLMHLTSPSISSMEECSADILCALSTVLKIV